MSGAVFQAGKSQTGYLMNAANLGGVGGQTGTLGSFCGNDVDGGNAINGNVVYVPCMNGLEAVQVTSPTSAGVLWQTSTGSRGPAVVAGGEVWSIGGNTLRGLNPANGTTVQQFTLSGEDNHFPTPSVADGLLLAPESSAVAAFAGPAGLPPPPPPAPPRPGYWLARARRWRLFVQHGLRRIRARSRRPRDEHRGHGLRHRHRRLLAGGQRRRRLRLRRAL